MRLLSAARLLTDQYRQSLFFSNNHNMKKEMFMEAITTGSSFIPHKLYNDCFCEMTNWQGKFDNLSYSTHCL